MKRICLICKREFDAWPSYIKRGGGKYCSRKCKDRAQSIRMKAESPEKSPRWKGGLISKKCLKCGKEINVKKCFKDKSSFCSRNCANTYNTKGRKRTGKILMCKVCNKEFYRNHSAINRKEKKPQYCSQRCRAIASVKKQRKKDTNIEQKLEEILIDLGLLTFEKQKAIQNICLVDFFIPPNICIFADGDYWHSLKKRIEVDKRQNKELIEAGYKVIRIKGKEILKGNIKDKLCSIIN